MNTKTLKPFDLEAALRGEPVMLRNGMEAFVRHHETKLAVDDDYRLWGVDVGGDAQFVGVHWTQQGRFISSKVDDNLDIIGMYPKTRIINGFEVPAPETNEPESHADYYLVSTIAECFYRNETWSGHRAHRTWHRIWLERGLVFLNKEDAIANAKAMLGIDPYEEGEE